MSPQAVETWYAGHKFRSRLEARWAVFFNELDIDWTYEPERFKVGEATYLPDFYVEDFKAYVEVKGDLDQETSWFLGDFAETLDFPQGCLLLGQIPGPNDLAPHFYYVRKYWLIANSKREDWPFICSQVTFWADEDNRVSLLPIGDPEDAGISVLVEPTRDLLEDQPLIRMAFAAARSARFEYGQYGSMLPSRS